MSFHVETVSDQEERESDCPDSSERREFLKGVLAAVQGAVVIGVSNACTSAFFTSKDSFQAGFDRVMLRLHDPHGYFRGPFKYLDERRHEYVLPDDVINRFYGIDVRAARTGGFHARSQILDPRNSYDYLVLCNVLSVDLPHYTSEEISFFASVFCLNDAIVIAESRLSDPIDDFISTLLHERMHRELFRLESDEKDLLMDAAHAFLNARRGKHLMSDVSDHGGNKSLDETWEEFYCLLVSGRINPRVMSDFDFEYPEAFLLFQRLEDKCRYLTKLD